MTTCRRPGAGDVRIGAGCGAFGPRTTGLRPRRESAGQATEPLVGVGQQGHGRAANALQAALANQAARGVAHRELVVDGAGVPEPGDGTGEAAAGSQSLGPAA